MSSHCSKIFTLLPKNCCPYVYSNVTQRTMVGLTEIQQKYFLIYSYIVAVSPYLLPTKRLTQSIALGQNINWIKEPIQKIERVTLTSSRVFLLMASFLSILRIYRSLVSVIFGWKLEEDFDTKCIKYEVVTFYLNTF